MNYKTPTSPKLMSFENDRADKKALAVTENAELFRLTNLDRADSYEATIVNRSRPIDNAAFDLWPIANRTTSVSETDEALQRNDDRDRILRGEPLAAIPDRKSLIRDKNRRCQAIDDAITSITREIKQEKAILAQQFCNEQKPQHDKDMAILCKGLIDAHAAFVRLNKLRQHLKDNDMGFRGVCLLLPDAFLDHPLNKHSQVADFLRAAKTAGYINNIPTEIAA